MSRYLTTPNWRILILQLIFSILSKGMLAQQSTSSSNSDFESGDFTNWTGHIGANSGPPTGVYMNSTEFLSPRQSIINGTGLDANSCNAISKVYPGSGGYSAKVGNENSGAEAEDISYTFKVDTTNNLLVYSYALLLQIGYHTYDEESFFEIKITDASNNIINAPCSYLMFNASNTNGADWNTCNSDVKYKNWETFGVDLSSYIGQSITIVFTSADCALGGHFGYGYVDMYTAPLKIEAQYCGSGSTATLKAPEGFTYLWSPGGQTSQSIQIPNAQVGSIYQCTLSSIYNPSCQTALSTTINAENIQADFIIQPINCPNDTVYFTNTSTISNGNISNFKWDFGDISSGTSNSSTAMFPTHLYTKAGSYIVTLEVSSNFGCKDTVSKSLMLAVFNVSLNPFPDVCLKDAAFMLSGGFPLGGVYMVDNNVNAQFDPIQAGIGLHSITYQYSIGLGCIGSDTQTVQVDVCTNIKNDKSKSQEKIWPNPFYNSFEIHTNETNTQINIYDMNGKICKKYSFENIGIYDLGDELNDGIYFVEIISNKDRKYAKVAKIH